MQFTTSMKTARDTWTSSMPTEEEASSDEYMRSLGFVEMTSAESREYDRFFKCADGPRRFLFFKKAIGWLKHAGFHGHVHVSR
jgi:hypothetical protein